MTLCSTGLSELKVELSDREGTPRFIEDSTYLDNAIHQLKLCKAFDLLDQATLSFKHATRAYKIVDSLVQLRQEGQYDYTPLLAPFYFKLADSIATFCELNTDEFGNVKPLVCTDSDDESDNVDDADEEDEEDPREE